MRRPRRQQEEEVERHTGTQRKKADGEKKEDERHTGTQRQKADGDKSKTEDERDTGTSTWRSGAGRATVREDDLPVVFHTLLGELNIYKEENGDLVPILSEESNGVKTRNLCDLTVHPVQSPGSRFCVLTLDRDTLPSISPILLDVLFYSHISRHGSPVTSNDTESFHFFAFSLIDGYISIVMDAETKKKFPTDLLLTSSSGELWRMVRIGGQPLGFDECGIVAQIAEPLAAADISAYYISTFNFDHALVPEDDINCVIELLNQRQENNS